MALTKRTRQRWDRGLKSDPESWPDSRSLTQLWRVLKFQQLQTKRFQILTHAANYWQTRGPRQVSQKCLRPSNLNTRTDGRTTQKHNAPSPIYWMGRIIANNFICRPPLYITAIHCKLNCILKLNKCIGPEIAGLKRTLPASVMTPAGGHCEYMPKKGQTDTGPMLIHCRYGRDRIKLWFRLMTQFQLW